MEKYNSRWNRFPGLILLFALGVAAFVIAATNWILPIPSEPLLVDQVAPSPAPVSAIERDSEIQDREEQQAEQLEQLERSEDVQPVQQVAQEESSERSQSIESAQTLKQGLAQGCFQIRYRHKALGGHPDREHCSRHRNLIPIGKDLLGLNWNSLCLRVDGVVTAFERTPSGIVFGPFAGPDSNVSLRYCTGQAKCAGGCEPPRDLFLEAIGASLKRERRVAGAAAAAGWDPAAKADAGRGASPTAAIEAELRDFAGAEEGFNVFKQWAVVSRSHGCGGSNGSVAANSN